MPPNPLAAAFWRAAEQCSREVRDAARGFDGEDLEKHLTKALWRDGIAARSAEVLEPVIGDGYVARLVGDGLALAAVHRFGRPEYASLQQDIAEQEAPRAAAVPPRTPLLQQAVQRLFARAVADARAALKPVPRGRPKPRSEDARRRDMERSLALLFGDDRQAAEALAWSITTAASDLVSQDREGPLPLAVAPTVPTCADMALRAAVLVAEQMATAAVRPDTPPADFQAWVNPAASARIACLLDAGFVDRALIAWMSSAILMQSAFRAMRKVLDEQDRQDAGPPPGARGAA